MQTSAWGWASKEKGEIVVNLQTSWTGDGNGSGCICDLASPIPFSLEDLLEEKAMMKQDVWSCSFPFFSEMQW